MRKAIAITAMSVLGILGLLLVGVSASASSFTVSPWAYACGHTTTANPAVAHDPGEAGCPHPDNGGKSYCPNGDTLGEASAAYTAGKLTLTKSGEICDDLASGATIGGLKTLDAAGADCLTVATCNPGGNLRLNVVDSAGKLHFIGGTMNAAGHVTFNVEELKGLTLKSINVVADNPGTVVLSNLTFTGEASPSPSASASASPSASATVRPSASASPVVTVIAQTGGGVPFFPLGLLAVGLLLITSGGFVLFLRKM